MPRFTAWLSEPPSEGVVVGEMKVIIVPDPGVDTDILVADDGSEDDESGGHLKIDIPLDPVTSTDCVKAPVGSALLQDPDAPNELPEVHAVKTQLEGGPAGGASDGGGNITVLVPGMDQLVE